MSINQFNEICNDFSGVKFGVDNVDENDRNLLNYIGLMHTLLHTELSNRIDENDDNFDSIYFDFCDYIQYY